MNKEPKNNLDHFELLRKIHKKPQTNQRDLANENISLCHLKGVSAFLYKL